MVDICDHVVNASNSTRYILRNGHPYCSRFKSR